MSASRGRHPLNDDRESGLFHQSCDLACRPKLHHSHIGDEQHTLHTETLQLGTDFAPRTAADQDGRRNVKSILRGVHVPPK